MQRNRILRYLAGILLICSAFTHVIQMFFVGTEAHTLGAVAFGVLYGIIGVILITYDKNKYVPLLCAILPAIGGVLGFIRFVGMLMVENIVNYFIIFHLTVDIIVVPICILLYRQLDKK